MDPGLEKLIAAARRHKMSAEERHEQRINFAHGNRPREMAGDPIENMYRTDSLRRSPGGWDGTLASLA